MGNMFENDKFNNLSLLTATKLILEDMALAQNFVDEKLRTNEYGSIHLHARNVCDYLTGCLPSLIAIRDCLIQEEADRKKREAIAANFRETRIA